MVKIKQIPEDFVVEEIFEKRQDPRDSGKIERGFYTWFTLKKTNWDLFRALKVLGKSLGVSVKRFGYAGVKDKKAITSQKISVWNVEPEGMEKIKIKGMELSDFEKRKERINLGDLKGNRFKITVREIERMDKEKMEKNLERVKKKGLINFFGEQRFGSGRRVTNEVGKFMVKGYLKGAVWTYLTKTSERENENVRRTRKNLNETGDFKMALKEFHGGSRIEITLLNHLVNKPNDYAGALRKLPKSLRRLFVHAYQACLWNEIAEQVSEKGLIKNMKIPLIGYETDLNMYREIKNIIDRVLGKEGLGPEDFRIKRMPELSSEGDERNLLTFPEELTWEFGKDELNPGKLKLALKFEIPRGSYATTLIKEITGDKINYENR